MQPPVGNQRIMEITEVDTKTKKELFKTRTFLNKAPINIGEFLAWYTDLPI